MDPARQRIHNARTEAEGRIAAMLDALPQNERRRATSWKRAMEILSELCETIEKAETAIIRIPYRTVIWIPRHHDVALEIFRFFQAVQLFAEKNRGTAIGENDVIIAFENIAAENCRPAVTFLQCNVSPLAQRDILALKFFQEEEGKVLTVELIHADRKLGTRQMVVSGCEDGLSIVYLPTTVHMLENIWVTYQECPS